jgi:hypothetical protein
MLGVRLYASSLLLIREGDPDGDILLDIKMIDFANARCDWPMFSFTVFNALIRVLFRGH